MNAGSQGLEKIKASLEHFFRGVQDELLAQLKKAYRGEAERRYESMIELSKVSRGRFSSAFRVFDFLTFDWSAAKKSKHIAAVTGSIDNWEDFRALIAYVRPDYKKAERLAQESYENARDSFITKNLSKFESVLGKDPDVRDIKVSSHYESGAFDGSVIVELANAEIYAKVSLKYVIRTIPRVTPYYQYPLLFRAAVVDGVRHKAPSEEELRMLLGGASTAQVETEAAKQSLAEGWCPGSGQDVPSDVWSKIYNHYVKTARCVVCGAGVAVPHGKFRKHKLVGS